MVCNGKAFEYKRESGDHRHYKFRIYSLMESNLIKLRRAKYAKPDRSTLHYMTAGATSGDE